MAEKGRLSFEQRRNLPYSTLDPKVHICGAVRFGKTCGQPAGLGTVHYGYGTCKWHGGCLPNHIAAAAKEEAMVYVMSVMGPAIDIDPMEALLTCVRITAGEVAYATIKIEDLTEDEALITPVEHVSHDATGGEKAESYEEEKTSNVAQLNIWIATRASCMDRLARYSKMALDAGIEAKKVALAEMAGDGLAAMLQEVLGALELTADQERKAPGVVRNALRKLEGLPAVAEDAPQLAA
jgi:hypothetical protein